MLRFIAWLLLFFPLSAGCDSGVVSRPVDSWTVVIATEPDCPPCRRAKPFIERLKAARVATIVELCPCDPDQRDELDAWGIDRYPTFIVVKNGVVVYRGANVQLVLKGFRL